MATDKKVFTLRMQENNLSKIKRIAEIEKRSLSLQIEYIIEKYIEEYEQEYGSLLKLK